MPLPETWPVVAELTLSTEPLVKPVPLAESLKPVCVVSVLQSQVWAKFKLSMEFVVVAAVSKCKATLVPGALQPEQEVTVMAPLESTLNCEDAPTANNADGAVVPTPTFPAAVTAKAAVPAAVTLRGTTVELVPVEIFTSAPVPLELASVVKLNKLFAPVPVA